MHWRRGGNKKRQKFNIFAYEVLGAGVEPALVSQHGPQPCASANSATRAAMAKKVIFVRLKSTMKK